VLDGVQILTGKALWGTFGGDMDRPIVKYRGSLLHSVRIILSSVLITSLIAFCRNFSIQYLCGTALSDVAHSNDVA